MYCQLGQKPIIKYKFGNGSERVYRSRYAPIEVITKPRPLGTTDNFSEKGYRIDFLQLSPTIFNNDYIVHDYEIFSYGQKNYIAKIRCGFNDWDRISGQTGFPWGDKFVQELDITTLRVNSNQNCATQRNSKCSIQIIHENTVIFQDQGECPVTFSVQCDDCADDEIKCKKASYPGYCCIKCSEVSFGLQLIEDSLRSKI